MKRILLLIIIFVIILAGCANSKLENRGLSIDEMTEGAGADWPVYTFEELVKKSETIALLEITSESKDKKNNITTHVHEDDQKIHEHYIPSKITEAKVIKVLKGEKNIEGHTITLNQLTIEEILNKPNQYIAFLRQGTDGYYYSKGLNPHAVVRNGQVVSKIKDKKGTFALETFENEIQNVIKKTDDQ